MRQCVCDTGEQSGAQHITVLFNHTKDESRGQGKFWMFQGWLQTEGGRLRYEGEAECDQEREGRVGEETEAKCSK